MGPKRKSRLQCEVCEKVFYSLVTLKRHQNFHVTRKRGYKCEKCLKHFMSKTFFENHRCKTMEPKDNYKTQEHVVSDKLDSNKADSDPSTISQTLSSSQMWKCGFCQGCFVSSDILNQHMALTTAKRHHKCTECTKGFRCAQQFYDHFMTHNSQRKVCYVCGEILDINEDGMKKHVTSHAEVEEVHSERSGKDFPTEIDEEQHDSADKSKAENSITGGESDGGETIEDLGPVSGNVFLDADVVQHLSLDYGTEFLKQRQEDGLTIKEEAVESNVSTGPTRRSVRTFRPTEKRLKYDKRIKQDVSPAFVCTMCKKVCATRKALYSHMKTHIDDNPLIHRCDICKKTFTHRRYLQDHMKVHTSQEPHKCHVCGLMIKYNPSNFRRHMKKHMIEREFSCPTCSRTFYRGDILRAHMRTHANTKTKAEKYKCPTCHFMFSSTKALNRHMGSHSDTKDVPCTICDKTFIGKRQYHDHWENEHNEEKEFQCNYCEKALCSRYRLEKHKVESHLSELSFGSLTQNGDHEVKDPDHKFDNISEVQTQVQSPKLDSDSANGKRSVDKNTLPEPPSDEKADDGLFEPNDKMDDHEYNTVKEEPNEPDVTESDNEHQCNICGKTFTISSNLRRHMRAHAHSVKATCHICKKKIQKRNLIQHISAVHYKSDKKETKTDHLQCHECPKRFRRKCDLALHVRVHSGVRNYTCEVCNSSYFSKSNLNRHKVIHDGPPSNICHICGKVFACRNYLLTHIKRTHETVNTGKTGKIPCPQCDKMFISYSNFKRHFHIHTGERRHKCDVCSKTFRRTDDLAVHRKTHSTEKPFQCEICAKLFNQYHNLKKHVKRHSRVKTIYQCDKCGKYFKQRGAFARHEAKHDNEVVTKPRRRKDKHVPPVQDQLVVEPTRTDEILTSDTDDKSSEPDPVEPVLSAPVVKAQKENSPHISRTAEAIAEAISSIQEAEGMASIKTGDQGASDTQYVFVIPNSTGASCVYKCSLCDRGFREINTLIAHMVDHS